MSRFLGLDWGIWEAVLTGLAVLFVGWTANAIRVWVVGRFRQRRERLARGPTTQESVLAVAVRHLGMQLETGPLFTGEPPNKEEAGVRIWLNNIQITNQYPDRGVSLEFHLEIKPGKGTTRLSTDYCKPEEVEKLKCLSTPLGVAASETVTGRLPFLSPPWEKWIGDLNQWPVGSYTLIVTDLVSEKSRRYPILP